MQLLAITEFPLSNVKVDGSWFKILKESLIFKITHLCYTFHLDNMLPVSLRQMLEPAKP